MNIFLGLAGGLFLALLCAMWWSPDVCRLVSAALLTHADATDEGRDARRRHWDRYSTLMRLPLLVKNPVETE